MIEEAPAKAPQRKTKIGIVVSDKMQKTCVVAVDNFQRHPLYGRTMRRTRRFKVHDEENTCKIGDQVEIAECRPMSRTKHHRLLRIVERAPERAIQLSAEEVMTGKAPEER